MWQVGTAIASSDNGDNDHVAAAAAASIDCVICDIQQRVELQSFSHLLQAAGRCCCCC